MTSRDILFEVQTPLGFGVRVTVGYWQLIVTFKHPVMLGREADVQVVLRDPHEIRKSTKDPNTVLFYRQDRPGRWTCVAAKTMDGEGFLITTYPTDAIKEGEQIWTR